SFPRLHPPPPLSPLFPYTTLFRSSSACRHAVRTISSPACAGDWRIVSEDSESFPIRPFLLIICTHRIFTRERPDWKRFGILRDRSEEHTSELQSLAYLVCRLLLEK